MSWPGKAADDWWDGLSTDRKEQVHRWITQRRACDDLPEHQLAFDDLLVTGGADVVTSGR